MFFECLPIGLLGSNCYIVGDSGEAAIIDAGVSKSDIEKVLHKNNLNLKYIFITHGHADHICELNDIYKDTGAEVIIHEEDSKALANSNLNFSSLLGLNFSFRGDFSTVKGGEVFKIGTLDFEILHTPGHSKGCVSIKVHDMVFTGDTLFRESIGRTDLEGADTVEIFESIKNKLFTLDDNTVVYPGHGESSTIGYEKSNNRFFNDI